MYETLKYYRLDRSYQCTPNRSSEDYSFQHFGIQFVYDKFCEDVDKIEKLYYGKKIGFKSKEECQKYCDWLNGSKDIEDEDIS